MKSCTLLKLESCCICKKNILIDNANNTNTPTHPTHPIPTHPYPTHTTTPLHTKTKKMNRLARLSLGTNYTKLKFRITLVIDYTQMEICLQLIRTNPCKHGDCYMNLRHVFRFQPICILFLEIPCL